MSHFPEDKKPIKKEKYGSNLQQLDDRGLTMQFDYDKNEKPILRMEENGVIMTISFSEEPKNSNLKRTIIDLLTSVYGQKVIGATIQREGSSQILI